MFVDYGSSAATPRYPVAPLRECEWDESRPGLRLSDFRAYIGVHQLVGTVDELMGGLYARVSTHDQKTLSLQLLAMRDYAEKRGTVRGKFAGLNSPPKTGN